MSPLAKVITGVAIVGVGVGVAVLVWPDDTVPVTSDCGRLVLTPELAKSVDPQMQALVSDALRNTDRPALELFRSSLRLVFPKCSFADDAKATLAIDPAVTVPWAGSSSWEHELEWSEFVAKLKGKSIADVMGGEIPKEGTSAAPTAIGRIAAAGLRGVHG